MKSFLAHPNTTKLEITDPDESPGVFSYKYDEQKVTNSDIHQILRMVEMVMGSLENTMIIMEPDGLKHLTVILAVKSRSNMRIGTYRLMR